jgi:hypothetical protein
MTAASKNGNTCERNTPRTRLVRSIQKCVFASPAQARLPAQRPGPREVLRLMAPSLEAASPIVVS